MSANII